jgi:prolyl-tRNA synthetase
MEVNETKLANAIDARWLKPATAEEIQAVGCVPGYASPIGIDRAGVIVAIDELIAGSPNLVSGANEAGYHLRNVNAGRDYRADVTADLTAATEGSSCARCGAPLRLSRGVEVGNIFQLGTHFSESLGAHYLDAEGQSRPVVMGSYGIGVGRILACLAEKCHDARGLKLPVTVAPYELHLVRLSRAGDGIDEQADALYDALRGADVQVLYDDRDASPGVKFADADLIGLPLRATISARSLQAGGVELKRRESDDAVVLPIERAVEAIREVLSELYAGVADGILAPTYPAQESEAA